MDIGTLTGSLTLEDQMSATLARVNQVLDRFGNTAQQNLDKVQEGMTWATLKGSFLGNMFADVAMKAVSFGKEIVTSSLMAGARLEQLEVATRFLGEGAGYSAKFIDDLAKKIEKSGIDGISAREAIVQLENANIDLSHASELSALAQNMQSISGRSSSEVFQAMTRAISMGNTEILKNLGFQINMDQVTRKYTETTGKAASSITAQMKTQMVMNAVLEDGASKTGLYAKSMETAGKQASSAERAWNQVSQQIGTILLPITSTAIKAWYKFGEAVRDTVSDSKGSVAGAMQSMAASLQVVIVKVGEFAAAGVKGAKFLIEAYQAVPDVFKFIGRDALIAAAGIYALSTASSLLVKTTVWSWGVKAVEMFQEFRVGVQGLGVMEGAIVTTNALGASIYAATIGPLVAFIAKLYASAVAAGVLQAALARLVLPIAAIAGALSILNTGRHVVMLTVEAIERLHERERQSEIDKVSLVNINNKLHTSYTDVTKATEAWAKANEKIRLGYRPLADVLEGLETHSGSAKTSIADLENTVLSYASSGTLGWEETKQIAEALHKLGYTADQLPPALKNIVEGIDNWKEGLKKLELTDFEKKVQSITGSIHKSNDEVGASAEAYHNLDIATQLSVEGRKLLTTAIDEAILADKALTDEQRNNYQAMVENRINTTYSAAELLKLDGYTQDYITTLKTQGMTDEEIARLAGVKIEAFQRLSAQIAENTKLTEAALSMEVAAHHDNVNDWIKLEEFKGSESIRVMRETGNFSAEQIEQEIVNYRRMIDQNVTARLEQITTSKAYYQMEVDNAKNHMDLVLANQKSFSMLEIQLAEENYDRKLVLLDNWEQKAETILAQTAKFTQTHLDNDVKAHHNNINDWIAAETFKNSETIRLLAESGKATKAMLDQEVLDQKIAIGEELRGRFEQINTSMDYYKMEADAAKNKLDLMLANQTHFVALDIQLAQEDFDKKNQILANWETVATATLQRLKDAAAGITTTTLPALDTGIKNTEALGTKAFTNIDNPIDAFNADLKTAKSNVDALNTSLTSLATNPWSMGRPPWQNMGPDYGPAFTVTGAGNSNANLVGENTGYYNPLTGPTFTSPTYGPSLGSLIPPTPGPGPTLTGGGWSNLTPDVGYTGSFTTPTYTSGPPTGPSLGSLVPPAPIPGTSTISSSGGQRAGDVNNTFNVNGTAEDVARKVSDILTRQLKSGRQLGN